MDEKLVIVVDDDKEVRDSLLLLLESVGYLTAGHPTGEDFLAATYHGRNACVLLDYNLPGLDGLDILALARTAHTELPVILISGRAKAGTRRLAKDAGALDLLDKPLREDELLGAIDRAFTA